MAQLGTMTGRMALVCAGLMGCFGSHGSEDGGAPDGGVRDAGGEWCVRLGRSEDGSACCLEERLVPLWMGGGEEPLTCSLGEGWRSGRCADYPMCRPVEPPCSGDPQVCFVVEGGECVARAGVAECDRATGTWRCAEGTRPESECPGSATCPGRSPRCFAVEGGACVTPARYATCDEATASWRCAEGTRLESECSTIELCAGRTLDECVSASHCVPMFDNACCPMCDSTGACADCTEWVYKECMARVSACDPAADFCSVPADGACEGRAPDCSRSVPSTETSCSVPGCVLEQSPPCDDCIPTRTCVPHRGVDMCQTTCFDPPSVVCDAGWIPEAQDGCYVESCIPASTCSRSDRGI